MVVTTHRILVLGALLGLAGLLPAQVNPAPAETTAARRAALVKAGMDEVGVTLSYDPAYVKIAYPGGDVPMDRGVCTDVVIRALRQVDIDLQVLVHEDKKKAPGAYPRDWGNLSPDANIDHRRVPNLMTFFKRQGKQVPATKTETESLPVRHSLEF